MKILIVDCTAEELRANRTVMDSLTEALSGFTRSLAGVDLTPEQTAEALANIAKNEEQGEEESKAHWIYGYTFPDGQYRKCSKCKELTKVVANDG